LEEKINDSSRKSVFDPARFKKAFPDDRGIHVDTNPPVAYIKAVMKFHRNCPFGDDDFCFLTGGGSFFFDLEQMSPGNGVVQSFGRPSYVRLLASERRPVRIVAQLEGTVRDVTSKSLSETGPN